MHQRVDKFRLFGEWLNRNSPAMIQQVYSSDRATAILKSIIIFPTPISLTFINQQGITTPNSRRKPNGAIHMNAEPEEIIYQVIPLSGTEGTGFEPYLEVKLWITGAQTRPYVLEITAHQRDNRISRDSAPVDEARTALSNNMIAMLKAKGFLVGKPKSDLPEFEWRADHYVGSQEIAITLNGKKQIELVDAVQEIVDMPPEQLTSHTNFLELKLAELFKAAITKNRSVAPDELAKIAVEFFQQEQSAKAGRGRRGG